MKKAYVIPIVIAAVILAGCKRSTPAKQAAKRSTQTAPVSVAIEETDELPPITLAADVSLSRSIEKLKEQAGRMTTDALKFTTQNYNARLLAMKKELKTKTERLNSIPFADKLGTEAQLLTQDIKTISDSLTAVEERMAVYTEALKSRGVDVGKFLATTKNN